MSLAISIYVPEGIVMASDSRQSISIETKTPEGRSLPKVDTVNSDNVYKTHLLSAKDKAGAIIYEVGIQSFGQDLLGGFSTASHIKRFSEESLTDEDNVETIAKKLVLFFRMNFATADAGFHVAGYHKRDRISIPYVYYCHVGRNTLERKNIKPDGGIIYGATWSGQTDVLSGIIAPTLTIGPDMKPTQMLKPPIIWDAMPLQDAIEFSVYAIRTTIDTIRFQARPKNVGGPTDVLVLTPDGGSWIQRKKLKAI